jgi:hypothetical protein
VLILLSVIRFITTALITIVNNTSANEEFPTGGRPGEFQSGQSVGVNQTPLNKPKFQGFDREQRGGEAFMAVELLKNLAIITIITIVIVVFRKMVGKLRSVGRAMKDV